MGISETQLNDIISTTLANMPKPTVADLLCAGGEWADWEVELVIGFIKDHYTKEEILAGMEEYLRRCKFVFKLFGVDK